MGEKDWGMKTSHCGTLEKIYLCFFMVRALWANFAENWVKRQSWNVKDILNRKWTLWKDWTFHRCVFTYQNGMKPGAMSGDPHLHCLPESFIYISKRYSLANIPFFSWEFISLRKVPLPLLKRITTCIWAPRLIFFGSSPLVHNSPLCTCGSIWFSWNHLLKDWGVKNQHCDYCNWQ